MCSIPIWIDNIIKKHFVQQQFSNELHSRYETFEKDPREIYDK